MSTTSTAVSAAFNGGVVVSYRREWECPHCPAQKVTEIPAPHSPFHTCPAFRGAMMPFVERGVKAAFRVNRREDYVGSDSVVTDGDGIPVMSVTTIREDGEDCAVFAPSINAVIGIG